MFPAQIFYLNFHSVCWVAANSYSVNVQKGRKAANIYWGPWLGHLLCVISFSFCKFMRDAYPHFKDREAQFKLHQVTETWLPSQYTTEPEFFNLKFPLSNTLSLKWLCRYHWLTTWAQRGAHLQWFLYPREKLGNVIVSSLLWLYLLSTCRFMASAFYPFVLDRTVFVYHRWIIKIKNWIDSIRFPLSQWPKTISTTVIFETPSTLWEKQ